MCLRRFGASKRAQAERQPLVAYRRHANIQKGKREKGRDTKVASIVAMDGTSETAANDEHSGSAFQVMAAFSLFEVFVVLCCR